MATFQIGDSSYYIDGRLMRDLDDIVIPDLKKKDKDRVFIVDGRERSGKSVFGMGTGAYCAYKLGTPFNITNICMYPEEFRNKIQTAQKNEVIIYDEAHRGMGSARALSEINNILKDLMMEMGQKNLLVIIILPSFFLLEKYIALFRSSGLFHIYERKGKRGFWCYFNESHKLRLYLKGRKEFNYNCMKWPYYRGRFLNQYPINEKEYRAKKARSFKGEERATKDEKYLVQRNILIHLLKQELGLTNLEMAKMFKLYGLGLKKSAIQAVLAKFESTGGAKG